MDSKIRLQCVRRKEICGVWVKRYQELMIEECARSMSEVAGS